MHPTHSCCAKGPQTSALLGEHRKDRSPVGANSPFRKVRDLEGQVAFLGVPYGARCNTSIHGVEETLAPNYPPYLFSEDTMTYLLRGTTAGTKAHNNSPLTLGLGLALMSLGRGIMAH